MHLTYELYVEGDDGARRFQALTCPADDLMREVRRIAGEPNVRAVEVCRLGERLFIVES